jgi:hypothetical protein
VGALLDALLEALPLCRPVYTPGPAPPALALSPEVLNCADGGDCAAGGERSTFALSGSRALCLPDPRDEAPAPSPHVVRGEQSFESRLALPSPLAAF